MKGDRMKVPKCKGMRDLLPDDMAKFRRIEEVFRSCSSKWGYEEVRTPTLECLHLFTATGTLTPGTLGRVYSFLDWDGWSGERVVLRPEGTIPTARLYVEGLVSSEISRLCYVGNTFIFEGTGKEQRERWQCGVELIGTSQPLADTELVILASEVLEELGIGPLIVKLSHAGLIKALIAELGLESMEQTQIFDQVLDGNIRALGDIDTENINLKRALTLLLDTKRRSPGFLEDIRALLGEALPRFEPSLKDLSSISELLETMNCTYEIDIASGRGFEYYTGVMFQLYISKKRVGRGGRYDDLISLVGGPHIPASGFALYVDQLMDFINIKRTATPRILVQPGDTSVIALKSCFKVADSLREAGCVVVIDQGQKEIGDYPWILRVSGETLLYLTNQSTGKKYELNSEVEIRQLVENSG
jgi:histidyl-tRNA synthetase